MTMYKWMQRRHGLFFIFHESVVPGSRLFNAWCLSIQGRPILLVVPALGLPKSIEGHLEQVQQERLTSIKIDSFCLPNILVPILSLKNKKQNPNAQQLIHLILTSLASNGEGAVRPVLGDPRDCTVECLGSCLFTPRSRATSRNSGVLYRWLPKRHEYIGKFSKKKVAPTQSSSFWILVRDFNDFNISGSSPKHGHKTFCRSMVCCLRELPLQLHLLHQIESDMIVVILWLESVELSA